MRIGIVGGGVVGRATARSWLEHVEEVRVYDVVHERATHTLEQVLECEFVFVCLPTPQIQNSIDCDLSYVTNFFKRMEGSLTSFILRSTVPIGTTRMLRVNRNLDILHSPEFLTARCAVTDAQLPARNIIGGQSGESKAKLADLYSLRFPGVPLYLCTSSESEAIKLLVNGFFAVKVAYFNEIYQLVERTGMDWDLVLRAVLSDGRIGHSHTKVPGPDGKYGFGGTCLPKDLDNLAQGMYRLGLNPALCRAASIRNIADRAIPTGGKHDH